MTTSIKTGLQQAILAQKTFAPGETQRDESILHNQGELGLKATPGETFRVDSAALEEVVATHPTGEVPVIASDDDAGGAPERPRPYLPIEEPPDGPVPEDVIARFAQMVEAEQERAAERAAREGDDRG